MKENFYQKFGKRIFDVLLSSFGLIFLWQIFVFLALIIKLSSPGPIIFRQKRVGKDGKIFTIYKFRTMVAGAENIKVKYQKLNEADGPVFKIKNDPRFTRIGKVLSHTGLDELPQLVNILKGEMSLVGPRPLPVNEEAKIPMEWQKNRRQVKPGLCSSWLINGAHGLSFKKWMELDSSDIKKSCLSNDLKMLIQTFVLAIKLIIDESRRKNHFPFLQSSK